MNCLKEAILLYLGEGEVISRMSPVIGIEQEVSIAEEVSWASGSHNRNKNPPDNIALLAHMADFLARNLLVAAPLGKSYSKVLELAISF